MTDPSTFQSLVTDFAHEGSERGDGVEQVHFYFDNGYTVSAIRGTTEDGRSSKGYENGNWELMFGVRDPNATPEILEVLPYGNPLYEHELYDEGDSIIANADNARINEVLATVQALPPHEPVEVDFLTLLLAGPR